MGFRGSAIVNLDSKGRLAIPARYREALQQRAVDQLILTADPSQCLLLYPLQEWGPIEEKLNAISSFNAQSRAYQRVVVGYAEDIALDGMGRMLVSPELRSFAALQKRVVMIGQGRKFELWNEDLWQRQCEAARAFSEQAMPSELEGFTL